MSLEIKYFVLNPNKNDIYGTASRKAMLTYANVVKEENLSLAEDLNFWVASIEDAMPKT